MSRLLLVVVLTLPLNAIAPQRPSHSEVILVSFEVSVFLNQLLKIQCLVLALQPLYDSQWLAS